MNIDYGRRLSDKDSKNPTIIAKASIFQGDLRSSCPVIVSGMVEGDCAIENTLTIEKSGTWVGTIHALSVVVNGKIKGNVKTDGKVEIGPTGQIYGNVTAGTIAIASGAVIEGDMHMIERDEPVHFEEKRQQVVV